ncbi:MAG: hypothetical protein GY947_14160 [Rhodobacteraceae bacterium]|nr:hypothetical protein [Paracoccaceae bacterium]
MAKKIIAVFFFVLSLILILTGKSNADGTDNCQDRAGWVQHAWDHFNDNALPDASLVVDACLGQWIAQAQYDQNRFPDIASCPPSGSVSTEIANDIFSNGVLNDVGTMLWIRARSSHLQNRIALAADHYTQCAELICARTWDPSGFFWAPGENCQARLDALPQ